MFFLAILSFGMLAFWDLTSVNLDAEAEWKLIDCDRGKKHPSRISCISGCDISYKQAKEFIRAPRLNKDDREAAYLRRVGAAYLRDLIAGKNNLAKQGNGDEKNNAYFAAQYTKGLDHSPLNGLLTAEGIANYEKLLRALKTEKQEDFNEIVRAPGAIRKFTNPQGAFTFSLEGSDSSLFSIEEFPKISSPQAAAQMIENYLLSLCRDVQFSVYGSKLKRSGNDSAIAAAIKILRGLGDSYQGPRTPQGTIDETVLFRGNSYGNLIGPYLSQFLLQPIKFIPSTVFPPALGMENLPQHVMIQSEQLYPIASERNFGIIYEDFVSIQNGYIPQPYEYSDYDATLKRYIINGRDLASYVHCDGPYQAYYNALTILFNNSMNFSKASPYSNGTIVNEDPFVSFGFFDVFSLMGTAAGEAGKAAWAQKWRAYRTLRPEAFAGLVHNAKISGSNPFDLDESLFNSPSGIDLLSLVLAKNKEQGADTYLLSLTYPEGSPLHPSYPSGHATIAGACITIIKAFLDDTAKLENYIHPLVKPDPSNPSVLIPLHNEGESEMTVASELDKLAFNIAIGRNFAGVHYRIDAEQGIRLGESVAIKLLQDHAVKMTEQTFTGFVLTKIDGTRIRITAKSVHKL